jgi:hypothetical protein
LNPVSLFELSVHISLIEEEDSPEAVRPLGAAEEVSPPPKSEGQLHRTTIRGRSSTMARARSPILTFLLIINLLFRLTFWDSIHE